MKAWSEFDQEYGILQEFPLSLDIGLLTQQEPLIITCTQCKQPIIAASFSHHLSWFR